MITFEGLIEKLGPYVFLLAMAEFIPVYLLTMLYLYIRKWVTRSKEVVLLRDPMHWESLNFVTKIALAVGGINIVFENKMENDLDEKPCIFMSNHASYLDV